MEQSTLLNNLHIQHGFYNALDSESVIDPILMNQVHSADALIIDSKPSHTPSVDALITNKPHLCLTVKTADCAPVLLADPEHYVIAAVHAGWKGAFQGILENTILKMLSLGASVNTLIASIGPHLQKQSFIAGDDMKRLFPTTEAHFFSSRQDGTYLFDFNAYLIYRLQRSGLQTIDTTSIDTFSNLSYYSFRRDPQNPKRQYSTICLTD